MSSGTGTRRGLLAGHRDFRRLWLGNAISELGTAVSRLALPLLAVTTLHAGTFQVAVLTALEPAVFVLLGLPVGAWADRTRRRPVLVAADVGRAVVLGSVPAAAALGALSIWQLYAVVVVCGVCTVFFDVSWQSYLPGLVGRDRLMEANGRLEANRSVGGLAGPSLGGFLVQWLTAPVAVLVDALSFAASAACVASIRTAEADPPPPQGPRRGRLRRDVGEGLRLVLGHPVLRAIAGAGATLALFSAVQWAIVVVFLVREVRLAPGTIGLLFTVSSVGAVAGALYATRIGRRFASGHALLGCAVLGGLGGLLVPLTAGGWRLVYFAAGSAVAGFFLVAFNVIQVSLRQALCPDRLLGRMNATMRVLLWSMIPAGGVLGGLLATVLGLRPTLWIAAAGMLLGSGWLLASPLRPGVQG